MIFKASRDTFVGSKFHKKVDGVYPIIILIFLETGLIFGAYTYKPLK